MRDPVLELNLPALSMHMAEKSKAPYPKVWELCVMLK
jgi:hypothetical protein